MNSRWGSRFANTASPTPATGWASGHTPPSPRNTGSSPTRPRTIIRARHSPISSRSSTDTCACNTLRGDWPGAVDYYDRRMSSQAPSLPWYANLVAKVEPFERRALLLAFMCNFVMMGSYYIFRPVRDAMATVFGASNLQWLFTGTLIVTVIVSPLFAWITDTFRLSRVLPGVFGFILVCLVGFFVG